MNADEFVEQPSEVQHLVEVRAKNVPRLHHYSIAYTDNPMSLSLFELKLLPITEQMSHGINIVAYVLPALPLSIIPLDPIHNVSVTPVECKLRK